ncbi:MAG: Crp/Fnr family transcriptional regulator [Deltaproteobacteria bacterium]
MPLPFQTANVLLRGLPDAEVRGIAAKLVERRFPRDAVVFHEGSDADALFIVKSGFVKLVALSEEGTEAILHIVRPGDVFGELAVTEPVRPFTAVALTDAVLSVLPRAALRDLLESSPAFARNLLELLSKRLGQVEREFAGLINAWAHHRLARELLHLAVDLGVETRDGTLIPLRLTHEELSNLIGTTRETVTILLRKFEDMGIIRRRSRRIVVDRPRLAEYAHIAET